VAVCLALLTPGYAVLAQDTDEAAVCGVLTPEEVGRALGTSVGSGIGWTYEGYATCNWIATDAASTAYADAEWQDIPLEQIVGGMPGGVELTVGGQPAYLAPDIGALFIRLDTGLLTLSLEPASPDADVVPRAAALPAPAASTGFEPPIEPEADPVAESFCALYTPEEVASVLGMEVESAATFESCSWSSTALDGSFASITAGWASGSLDDQKAIWTEGTDITVGGRPAWLASELGTLFIDTGDGIIMLNAFGFQADGTQLDSQTMLTELGELAMSRAADLVPPAPQPTFAPIELPHDDPDLEARFPSSIGGETVQVQSVGGEAMRQGTDPEFIASLEAALASQGKTLDDVSVAFGGAGLSSIFAVRVAGGDASAIATLLLESISEAEGLDTVPGQVGGKDVLIASDGTTTQHVYAQGEVVWVVSAEEPALTEILSALP
jgi:hypothetical protein